MIKRIASILFLLAVLVWPQWTLSAQRTVKVTVYSIPPGASVSVSGADIGTTPVTAFIPEGVYRFALQLQGFADRAETYLIDGISGGFVIDMAQPPSPPGTIHVLGVELSEWVTDRRLIRYANSDGFRVFDAAQKRIVEDVGRMGIFNDPALAAALKATSPMWRSPSGNRAILNLQTGKQFIVYDFQSRRQYVGEGQITEFDAIFWSADESSFLLQVSSSRTFFILDNEQVKGISFPLFKSESGDLVWPDRALDAPSVNKLALITGLQLAPDGSSLSNARTKTWVLDLTQPPSGHPIVGDPRIIGGARILIDDNALDGRFTADGRAVVVVTAEAVYRIDLTTLERTLLLPVTSLGEDQIIDARLAPSLDYVIVEVGFSEVSRQAVVPLPK
jgi:hypothetical protein